jgi:hypothetical protein
MEPAAIELGSELAAAQLAPMYYLSIAFCLSSAQDATKWTARAGSLFA